MLNNPGGFRNLVPSRKAAVNEGFAALWVANRITITGRRYFHVEPYATPSTTVVHKQALMGWTPPDGIDVPRWRC